ncbi:hypothetical protein NDU88_006982 [Pleurodeles waltl]|uniref:Uncharacterized protein n=1 Tax=Pleurodeles waltl TaxID=8319 RepID=A0AAV7RTG4_PLEWA|nr:hypothetical protein NDU88_006982 [Pleurodeles waltl]
MRHRSLEQVGPPAQTEKKRAMRVNPGTRPSNSVSRKQRRKRSIWVNPSAWPSNSARRNGSSSNHNDWLPDLLLISSGADMLPMAGINPSIVGV